MFMLYAFFWAIPRRLCFVYQLPTRLWRWNRQLRNAGIQNSDAGISPSRMHTTFRTGRVFEIKNIRSSLNWWIFQRSTFFIYLFIYDLLLRYSYNTCEVTNCSNNQFTTVSLWLFMYVRVKNLKVSAVKNKYYIKRNCSCRWRVYNNRCLIRLCIYFLYCTWRSGKV